jgi:phage shock protein C
MNGPDWGSSGWGGPPPPWGDGPFSWWPRKDWKGARRAAYRAWREANRGWRAGGGFDPGRLYRDTERGWIAGVCAGIADYLGTNPLPVRLAALLFLIFFFLPAIVAYIAFALVLKPKPPIAFATPAQEALWRELRTEPASVLHRLSTKLRGLDGRIRRMETLVTSEEFDLRRGFRDLGG